MESGTVWSEMTGTVWSEMGGTVWSVIANPPYASKWNPIEHRLFAHVHRAIQGAVFTDYELVAKLINKTKTKTGLKVVARLNQKRYNTGIKTPKSEIDYNRIQFHPQLPVLSYRICA